MERSTGIADWRATNAYADLHRASGPGLAWEWLRRRPDYVKAFRSGLRDAAAFGLARFEDPGMDAPRARPLWLAQFDPYVLQATAMPSADADALDLRVHRALATVAHSGGIEHVLFCDGLRHIRLDVRGVSLWRGPARLSFTITGLGGARSGVLALRRLIHLNATGRFSESLHRPEPRAARQVRLLRTLDALGAGAGQREIAAQLLGPSAARPGWRIEVPSMRSQAQRLVRDARRMAAGGYLALLR